MSSLALRMPKLIALRQQVRLARPQRSLYTATPRMQASKGEGEKGGDVVPAREPTATAVGPISNDPFFGFGPDPFFGRMNSLMEEMNALSRAFGMPVLDTPASRTLPRVSAPRHLAVDVKDLDDRIEVSADVPGVKTEDVKVSVSPDNVLTLSAERKSEVKEGSEEEGSLRIERSYGSFMRRFRLPDNVNVDGIKASLKEGELHLTIPKTEVKVPEHKTIQVETEK